MAHINPNKRYTVKELESLGLKKTTGEKKHFYYFKNGDETMTFRVIPVVGLHSATPTEDKLALIKSKLQGGKFAHGGGIDYASAEVEYANKYEYEHDVTGKRIKIIEMKDPYPVKPGTLGTIVKVDGLGQYMVKWDDGRTLSVIPEVDKFEILMKSGGKVADAEIEKLLNDNYYLSYLTGTNLAGGVNNGYRMSIWDLNDRADSFITRLKNTLRKNLLYERELEKEMGTNNRVSHILQEAEKYKQQHKDEKIHLKLKSGGDIAYLTEANLEVINNNGLHIGAYILKDTSPVGKIVGYEERGKNKDLFVKTDKDYSLPYSQVVVDESKVFKSGGKLWIQDAIKNKGALRRTAKSQGLVRSDQEKLSLTDLHKLEKQGGKTAKRAYLAETLKKFDGGGKIQFGDTVHIPSINKSGVVVNVITKKHPVMRSLLIKFIDGNMESWDDKDVTKIPNFSKGGETLNAGGKMNPYFTELYQLLKSDEFKEPTKEKYPTYLEAYKKHGNKAKSPYFEDIHFLWSSLKEKGGNLTPFNYTIGGL
jgi:hypothetical protein